MIRIFTIFTVLLLLSNGFVKAQSSGLSATDQELIKLRSLYPYPTLIWDSLRCAWYGECGEPEQNQLQELSESRSACPLIKRSFGWYSPGSSFSNTYWSSLTDLSYFNYDVNPATGGAINASQISNWGNDATVVAARNNGVKVNLCIKLFTTTANGNTEFATFFGTPSAQSTLITNAVNAVVAANANGINIDFEGGGLTGTYGTQFISFLTSLKSLLNNAVPNAELSVDLMGGLATASTASTFLPQLNSVADLVIMMGYDYYYDGSSSTGPVAPLYLFNNQGLNVSSDINSFLKYIDLHKFILGIPYYGRTWAVGSSSCNLSMNASSSGNAFTFTTLAANSSHYFDVLYRDPATFNAYSCYLYQGVNYKQGFYDDTYSYQKKYDVVKQRNIAGVALWRLGFDNGYSALQNLIADNFSSCAITKCTDTIYDMGGPQGNYHNAEDYTFTISPANASAVMLNFSAFDLEPGNDYLKIYNGSSTLSPLLVNLTGTSLPSAITASSGSMTLQFHSNSTSARAGYKAIYTCSTGAGTGLPDMIPTNQSLSNSTISAGGALTANCAENNIGTSSASPNTIRLYLSSDATLTPDSAGDTYLGYINVPVSINAGNTSSTYSNSITIPNTTSNGSYYVFFWADGGQTVNESIDNNNFSSAQLSVNGSTQNYTISTSSNPVGWGTITPTSSYGFSHQATVVATPNTGYGFVNWTENGNHVTSTASYTFNVTGDRNLTANFSACSFTLSSNSWSPYSSASSGSFWVYTTQDCNWTATTSGCSGMITLTTSTGTGNGMVTFTLSENTSSSPRTCTITVGGQTYTINQAGYVAPCATAPTAPNSLTSGIVGSNQTYLSWGGTSVNVTTFELERGLSSLGPFTLLAQTGNNFGFTDITGIPGTNYCYRVRACCNGNCSGYTNIDCITACALSTAPTGITTSADTICRGDSILLVAQGGSAGTGAMWTWRFNQCGTGNLVGYGSSMWVTPTVSGYYVVKPEGGNCAAAITCQIKYITVKQTPTAASITAASTTTFCEGSTVTLMGNNGGIWSNGETTASISANTSGDYFVTNTNICGSVTSNHIQVTSNPKPIANAGIDVSVCLASSTQIGSTTAMGYSYNWMPSAELSNAAIANPTANPLQSKDYILTVISPEGCISKDTVSVTVNLLPTILASNDQVICIGDSVTIGTALVLGNSYEWLPVAGLSNPTVHNTMSRPDTTTNYTLTVTDVNGCTNTDEVLVIVNDLPIVDAGNNVFITQGDSISIGGNPTASGNGILTYNWQPSTGLDSALSANPIASPTHTTTYYVSVSDNNGCSASDSITIIVNPLGCTYVISQNTVNTDASGTSETITVFSADSCEWSVNSGNCSWLSFSQLSSVGVDSFTITIPATLDTFTKQCTLSVQGHPISVTQFGNGSCNIIDTAVQVNGGCDLAAANISGATYQWYRNGTAVLGATSQYHTAIQNGYYHVKITLGNCIYQSSDHYLACVIGLEEMAIPSLMIYPNPSSGNFLLTGEVRKPSLLFVAVYNALAQTAFTKNIFLSSQIFSEEINVPNLPAGVYYLQLKIDKQVYNRKLIIR